SGSHNIIENSYFHGWSMTQNAWDGHAAISGSGAATTSFNAVIGDVIDGSDSSRATTNSGCSASANGAPCQTGWGFQAHAYEVHNPVIRYTSNAIEASNTNIIHDNLVEYPYATITGNPYGGPPPNVIEAVGGYSGFTFLFYNNIIRHNFVNVGLWP